VGAAVRSLNTDFEERYGFAVLINDISFKDSRACGAKRQVGAAEKHADSG